MLLLLEDYWLDDMGLPEYKKSERLLLTLDHFQQIKHIDPPKEHVKLTDLITGSTIYLRVSSVELLIDLGVILE
jgi:hypothetical protein